jgi:ubiquinone/menaquinone biosynthesis C-methylase UbiE
MTNPETEQKKLVQDHFDRWSEDYDSGPNSNWLQAWQKKIIEVMSPQPHQHILDVGCGTGFAVRQLSQKLEGGKVYGLDISPAMLAKARTNTANCKNTELVLGDAENLPYENEQFERLMCANCFHYFPNLAQVIREFYRVLKPGGIVYILDSCRDVSPAMIFYDLARKKIAADHVRYYHTKEIKSTLVPTGFQDIREELRAHRFFLHGKLITGVALISARK